MSKKGYTHIIIADGSHGRDVFFCHGEDQARDAYSKLVSDRDFYAVTLASIIETSADYGEGGQR